MAKPSPKTVSKAPALKPGDMIGVMAPSSFVERADIERAVTIIESKGFKVFVHPQTYERENQSAGSHLQKILALQGLWQREDIKAIWAAGGGNRALHILSSINFEAMKKKPKILIGFSDVTALLNAIYAHTGLPGIHGPVFKHLDTFKEWGELLALLEGKDVHYDMTQAKTLHEGQANGTLIGGCLSVFLPLLGTKDMPGLKGAILFLEDTDDHLSRYDRMFLHLRRAGVLEQISGLVIGEFLNVQEGSRPFGYTLEDILAEHTDGLDIPVIINAPFGHGDKLAPFPVGVKAKMIAQASKITLQTTESALLA